MITEAHADRKTMKRHSGKRLAADLVQRPELQSPEGRRAGWAALRSIPGWLASILLHLAVLLVLALVSLPDPLEQAVTIVSLKPTRGEIELEELELSEELEPVDEQVFVNLAPSGGDEAEVPDQAVEIALDPNALAATDRMDLSDFSREVVSKSDLLLEAGEPGSGALAGRGERMRARMVEKYGGSAGSERAVARALEWFVRHQRSDGSWSLDHRDGPCRGRCTQPGKMQQCFTGGTALALLPFLGAGQTQKKGQYQEQVAAGLKYLLRAQDKRSGSLVSGAGSMYSHGLSAIVLCEAYAMTQDPQLEAPAQAALNYIVTAQDPAGGGWRYFPQQPGDTSAVGWQLMALKSGHLGSLQVPPRTIRGVSTFLDYVQAGGGSRYGYTGPAADQHSMTAAGLLCRMYLGWGRQNAALQQGVDYLGQHGPAGHEEHTEFHMYYNYYATQVLRHYGGPLWEEWNRSMRDMLVERQCRMGHAAGSWDVPDWDLVAHDTENGGRLYYTSLATMILEVYYRHMPIYGQRAAEDDFPL